MSELGEVCNHGSLKRQCQICELESENARLMAELELQKETCKAEKLAEALRKISKYGDGIKEDWIDWLNIGKMAKAEAKQALAEYEKEEK